MLLGAHHEDPRQNVRRRFQPRFARSWLRPGSRVSLERRSSTQTVGAPELEAGLCGSARRRYPRGRAIAGRMLKRTHRPGGRVTLGLIPGGRALVVASRKRRKGCGVAGWSARGGGETCWCRTRDHRGVPCLQHHYGVQRKLARCFCGRRISCRSLDPPRTRAALPARRAGLVDASFTSLCSHGCCDVTFEEGRKLEGAVRCLG